MCAGPLKPPSSPKPTPTPVAPVIEPLKPETTDDPSKAAREADLLLRRRAQTAFGSTILTGAAGLKDPAAVKKKRLLGE